jgi:short-subunit dehydrogenase
MKTVLITGASTGIGKATALHLDKCGYYVFAGVRKKEDADNLREEASARLKPVILDVTDSKSIDNTFKEIEADFGSEFFGLVNNAGIGISGVLEAVEIEDVRKLMDVNVIGLLALTQKFIPLLKKSKGKIINIGSTSSYLSIPGGSAYAGSKFAVRAITDALRLELKHLGISVSLISPGAVESEIWNKSAKYKQALRARVNTKILGDYKEIIKFGDKLVESVKPIPAIKVANIVEKSLRSKKPKRYYFVGSDAKGAAKAARLPKRILDWILLKRIEKLGS